jgi:hypothetical protein
MWGPRWYTVIVALLMLVAGYGQDHGLHKKLLITLGGGVASTTMKGDHARYTSLGSTLEFAFDYGIARRWTLGAHYARNSVAQGILPNSDARCTVYQLIATFAPVLLADQGGQLMLGYGGAVTAQQPKDTRLPFLATHGSLSFGARWWRMITPGAGLSCTLWCTGTGKGVVKRDANGGAVPEQKPSHVSWAAVQLSVGALVRF